MNELEKAREALTKLIEGYEYEEKEVFIQDNGDKSTQRKKITKKHQPPNLNAIMFVLKNRDPENYKEEVGTEQEIQSVIKNLSKKK